jgi:hypothetical protein
MQMGYVKDKIVACSTFEETWWGACAGWLDERVGGWDGKAAVAGLGGWGWEWWNTYCFVEENEIRELGLDRLET